MKKPAKNEGQLATKPKLIIGSSDESLPIARAIKIQLSDIAEITVWKDGVFRLNDGNLETLLRILGRFDFAVFVLSPDDSVTSRGKTQPCPRDNALFEFGLFLGKLGKKRCFAVASDARDTSRAYTLKLPSDFHGVTVARYESDRSDENLQAAVSDACFIIRNAIKKVGARKDNGFEPTAAPKKANSNLSSEKISKEEESKKAVLEFWGIEGDEWIEVSPFTDSSTNWFHSERFTKAFPGVRGLVEFSEPEKAIERLEILLAKPLKWIWKNDDFGSGATPIWWWRGMQSMFIESYAKISPREILLDYQELPIKRIVAAYLGIYWQCFVYVEVEAKPPTGLYPKLNSKEVAEWKDRYGYVDEEYGLYQNHFVTRGEYDDGAAVIKGKPCRIDGAQLRVRYLTPYNLIIAPHESPINNGKFGARFEELMNGILRSKYSVKDLADEFSKLPKRDFRHNI